MKYLIVNQFILEINDEFLNVENKNDGSVEKRPYFYFLENKLNDLAYEAICYHKAALRIDVNVNDIKTIFEYFGGIGLQATINKNLFNPISHNLSDINEECVLNLNKQGFNCEQGDSYKIIGNHSCDLLVADFNNFTLLKSSRNPELLKKLYSTGSRFIILTDSAISKFHLNKKCYEKVLGGLEDLKAYFSHYSQFGYGVKYVSSHYSASYILLEKGYSGEFQFDKLETKKVKKEMGFKQI